MALNFLKRKKHSDKRVRLSNTLFCKNKLKQETDEYLEKIFGLSLKESPQDNPVSVKNNEKKKNPETLDSIEKVSSEKDVPEQNWDRGKERIEKLMYEISDLLTSEDLIKKRSHKMTESHSDKQNNPKQQDINEQSVNEQNKIQKNESSKLPLDIQELHNVAAMAKRLSERSKLKNHSIKNEQ